MIDNFPASLRRFREAAGKTQEQIAEDAGVTLNTYAHYERNSKRPAIKTFAALCVALNTSAERLLSNQPVESGLSAKQMDRLRAMDRPQLKLILELLQTIYERQSCQKR